MIMVLPPDIETTAPAGPREMVIVMDVSGCMAGPSIEQAKQAVALALDRLKPEDRFNIVAFNDRAWSLFQTPRPAISFNVDAGRSFVRGLEAGGGGEMAPALKLAMLGQPRSGALRQIVFVTDGAVSNETTLFKQVHDDLGRARLFTVGVGSAPNGYFMRGAFVQIEGAATLAAQMDGLSRPPTCAWDLAAWPRRWIHLKAEIAQILLRESWSRAHAREVRARPWPWADSWLVALLSVPRLGIEQIVLAGASGSALAFAPGHLDGTAKPGAPGVSVIGGHRDTHFRFLARLQPGDRVVTETPAGRTVWTVVRQEITARPEVGLPQIPHPALALVTRHPFDAPIAGGPERYLVWLEPADAPLASAGKIWATGGSAARRRRHRP